MRTPGEAAVLMEMVEMRVHGFTFQQIADKFGVSRQCVQQKIASLSRLDGKRRAKHPQLEYECIYPNLLYWMRSENVKLYELANVIGVTTKSTSIIRKKINW